MKTTYNKLNYFFLFTCSLILSITCLQAQTLTGRVSDVETKEPIPYATVSVKDSMDVLVTGGITSLEGTFSLALEPGIYKFIIQFMGYESYSGLINTNSNLHINAFLRIDSKLLEAVVVEGKRTTITQMIDKKVITLGSNLQVEGGNALDVMSTLPEVQADQDGAITLRGNANIQVLVNGKPSPLSVPELLRQIPSSDISSVEVITSPSAKYQADGLSGIINIITKSKVKEGVFTNLSTSFNTLGAHNHNVNTTIGGEKFNLKAGLNFIHNNIPYENLRERRGLLPYSQRGNYNFNGNILGLNAGLDWFPTAKDEFSFNINYNDNRHVMENSTIITQANTVQQQKTVSDHIHRTIEYNINYRKLFSDKNFLEIDLQHSNNENLLDGRFFPTINILDNNAVNDVLIDNAALDYSNKLSENYTLEAGYQFNRRMLNNSRTFFQENLIDSIDQFNNTQITHAIYTSNTFNISKLQIKLGLRLEHFTRNANFGNFENSIFNQNMTDLFPSMHIQYNVSEALKLNLGYNRRTSRPSLGQVNPNPLQFNEFYVITGNSDLEPEFSNNLDISLSFFPNRSITITPSLFGRVTNNLIVTDWNVLENGVAVMSFINGTKSNTMGAGIGFSVDVAKYWNTRIDGNFSYEKLDTPIEYFMRDYQKEGAVTINNDFELNKLLSANILYTYNFPITSYFTYRNVNQYLDLGIRLKILRQKGTVGLRFRDVFNTMVYDGTEIGIGFQQNYRWKPVSRMALVNFEYQFGRSKGKSRQRKNRNYGSGILD